MVFSLRILKSDLAKRPFVLSQVKSICAEVVDEEACVVLVPKNGKLGEMVSVLKYHKISYLLQSNNSDEVLQASVEAPGQN